MQYLLSPTPDHDHCPLPIEIPEDNRWRWHPYNSRVKHHIFRDRHQIPPPVGRRLRSKDKIVSSDWPEVFEQSRIVRELAKKEAGELFDEVFVNAAIERNLQVTPTSKIWSYREQRIKELEPDRKRQGRPPYFFDP